MAKYDTTKFYWLQLKEDFFDEDSIDWLEEQPNGKEYSLFYLKLCLKSLRTNGVLIRQVGNMLVPYDHVKLGELTKTNSDTVLVAMQLLTKIGLVQMLENGELYIAQVENMIGSQSKSAFKKQQQRITKKNALLLTGGQEVDNCPPDIEIEKEKEEEKQDKIDKQDKRLSAHFETTPFTNELINANYISKDDLSIIDYNELFEELLEEYDFKIVRACLWYFAKRYKTTGNRDEDGNEILNKFGYFKTAMYMNIDKLQGSNVPQELKEFWAS